MRLGKIKQLLHAVHQSFPPHTTRTDGDERLNDLEAVAERVVPRIEKRERAAAPIRGAHDGDVEDRQRRQRGADDVAVVETGREHHDGRDQHQRDRRPEVGLGQDQRDEP